MSDYDDGPMEMVERLEMDIQDLESQLAAEQRRREAAEACLFKVIPGNEFAEIPHGLDEQWLLDNPEFVLLYDEWQAAIPREEKEPT